MTNDLPTRLLVAIAETEHAAKRAGDARIAWANWTDDGKARCGVVNECDDEWINVDRAIEPTDVLVVWEQDAVLLLCQAHREIVEFHLVCMADHAQIRDRLANSEMRPVVRAEWEQKATEALIRLQLSDHYLGVLARAYNLEESP